MKTADIFNSLEPYREVIICGKIKALRTVIDYKENNYNPEYDQYHIISNGDKIEQLKKELKELQTDLNKKTPLRFVKVGIPEALNYLRAEAYRRRRTAIDFAHNRLIYFPNLRKAIAIAQTLIKVEPRLEIYSLHWIINATPITLN